ncbi:MAG: zinc ribbon domain-containing protein, partial [Methanomassiliicoccales archaeon]|nr:zinc ribbon domain-containing protein [Methanomassiliicoccales archaeon]
EEVKAEEEKSSPLPDIRCPNCGTINDGAATKCYACGQSVDEASIKTFESKKEVERKIEEGRNEAEMKAAESKQEEEGRRAEEEAKAKQSVEEPAPKTEPVPDGSKKSVSIRKIIKRK